MLTATIDGLDEANAKFSTYPAELASALDKTSNQLAAALLDKVRLDKLSGGALNSRTGALAGSISADVVATSDNVTASVSSSGVPYAGIQEYGGRTSAHEILPAKGQALAFLLGGEFRFARRIMHPGSVIPERSYLRSSLDELGPEIEAQMTAAVIRAWSDA